MSISSRETARNLWQILFQLQGSIWAAVLPYCILNCAIMVAVEGLAYYHVRIAFSPSGHGLMTLIVSFLVISKVNLTYDRYMNARDAIGHALSSLRDLNQASLTYTQHLPPSDPLASQWRQQTVSRIVDLMDCTIRVIRSEDQSSYLARNVESKSKTDEDPMLHAHALRSHLYTINLQIIDQNKSTSKALELFERMKMVDFLNEFVVHYRNLLKYASTPLPFPLLQMGRTFLFLWTFSIPLVLRGVVEEVYSAMAFVFFLTYGFVGLELVAMKLMNPFGDGRNDLNISGMRNATLVGIERDMELFGEDAKIRDPRLEYSRQKPQPPMRAQYYPSGGTLQTHLDHHTDAILHTSSTDHAYHQAP